MNSRNLETPGPGSHNPSDYNGGVYLLSNFRNHGTHQMKPSSRAKSRGEMSEKYSTPGPGTYQPPSDFGYLESYNSPRRMGVRS